MTISAFGFNCPIFLEPVGFWLGISDLYLSNPAAEFLIRYKSSTLIGSDQVIAMSVRVASAVVVTCFHVLDRYPQVPLIWLLAKYLVQ